MKPELEIPSAGLQARVAAGRYGVVSRLADDLAHEIKNPLSSILINLELVRQRTLKGDATGALERAAVIDEETHRVHDLVDGLLRLMRPQKDGAGPYSVAEAVSSVLPLVRARAHAAGVSLDGGVVPLEAYTPVLPDAIRFGLLVCASDAVHLAAAAQSAVALVGEVGEGSASLLLRLQVKPVAQVAVVPEAAHAESLILAAELLANAGGTMRISAGDYQIALPLSKR